MAWHPFRNLGLKVFALLLSVFLWMTVTRDQLVERSLRVPVEYQNIPNDLEITGDSPATVDVRVRGASSILGRLETGEVVAVVDLRAARPGQRLFHLMTEEVRVPFGIEVAQISPPTISLAFERSGTRVVPVVAAIEGEPADGYITGRVAVDPPTVEVVGPESRLELLREAVTEPVSVRNATRRVSDVVTVGVADAGLRLREARRVTVMVDVLPAPIERAVHEVPVGIRNLAKNLRSTVAPPRITVILQGSREALGSLDASALEVWVDASSLESGRYTLPVKVEAGQGFGVVRADPPTVQVRLR